MFLTGHDVKLLRDMSRLGSTLSTIDVLSQQVSMLEQSRGHTRDVLITTERARDGSTICEGDIVVRSRRE